MTVFARVNGSAFKMEDRGQSGKNEVKVLCSGKRCVVLMIMYLSPMERKIEDDQFFRFQAAGGGTSKGLMILPEHISHT